MKKCAVFVILLFVLMSTDFTVSLAEYDPAKVMEENMPEEAEELFGGISEEGDGKYAAAVFRLWDGFVDKLKDQAANELSTGRQIIIIAVLVTLGALLTSGSPAAEYIHYAGICVLASMLIDNMDGLIRNTVDTLYRLSDYSRAVIPAVFTAAAAGGAAVSAPVKYAAASMALDMIISLAQKLIIPLVYSYLALSLSTGLCANHLLGSCKKLIIWSVKTAMKWLTILFSVFMTVTGIITGTADALAVKTTRTVIAGVLPVVGGMISDAASAVLSAAGLVRNSVGTMAMLAVCAVCIEPFARLLVRSLIFKAGAAICGSFPGTGLSGFLSDVGNAADILLGLTGYTSIILLISICSAIRTVSG